MKNLFDKDTELALLVYRISYIVSLLICSIASYGILISLFGSIILGFAGYYFGLGGYRMTGTAISHPIQ